MLFVDSFFISFTVFLCIEMWRVCQSLSIDALMSDNCGICEENARKMDIRICWNKLRKFHLLRDFPFFKTGIGFEPLCIFFFIEKDSFCNVGNILVPKFGLG